MDRFKKFMKKGIDKVKSRVNKPSRGKDSKFFSGTKRGEIPELRGELHSGDRGVLKDAVKKVGFSATSLLLPAKAYYCYDSHLLGHGR